MNHVSALQTETQRRAPPAALEPGPTPGAGTAGGLPPLGKRNRVLSGVLRWRGSTSHELAEHLDMGHTTVIRELRRMRRSGHVEHGARRRCFAAGDKELTWWPTVPPLNGDPNAPL